MNEQAGGFGFDVYGSDPSSTTRRGYPAKIRATILRITTKMHPRAIIDNDVANDRLCDGPHTREGSLGAALNCSSRHNHVSITLTCYPRSWLNLTSVITKV